MEPTRREVQWLKRLSALVASQPPNTWVSVGSGIVLLRCGADGDRIFVPGTTRIDQTSIVGAVGAIRWDGGDPW